MNFAGYPTTGYSAFGIDRISGISRVLNLISPADNGNTGKCPVGYWTFKKLPNIQFIPNSYFIAIIRKISDHGLFGLWHRPNIWQMPCTEFDIQPITEIRVNIQSDTGFFKNAGYPVHS